MKKLKLEELQVESFDTCSAGAQARGTVEAHGTVVPVESMLQPCYPTDPNFDCTYGCSHETDCAGYCVGYSDYGCVEP